MSKNNLIKQSISFMVTGTILSLTIMPVALAEMQTGGQSSSCPNCPMQMDHMKHMQMMQKTTSGVSQQKSYLIPAGTGMMVHMTSAPPVATGETFTGQLINPVMVDGVMLFPAGSEVRGSVVGMDPVTGNMNIQFREVAAITGETIPIRSSATVSPLRGRVQAVTPLAAGRTFFPQVVFGRMERMTPAQKIVAATAGGAILGGATGTLAGLTMVGTSDDIGINEGSGAVRGLAWGSAYGAGLGLLGGLLAAAADRESFAVTSARAIPVRHPLTNISTGSAVTEIPVALPVTTTTGGASDYMIILDQPATVTF